jgi:myosin-5
MVSDSLHSAVECRFEYSITNLESSLEIEKQQHEASVIELADAHGKIEELLREVGNTDEKSTLLQSTIKRFFFCSC